MTIPVIRVGNSRGIRIPKAMLDQYGNPKALGVEAKKNSIVLRPVREHSNPRQGWEEACRKMAKLGDDRLLDAGQLSATEWDKTEWEW